MDVIKYFLGDVRLIQSPLAADDRGCFIKAYNRETEPLADFSICQINLVNNRFRNTLRGLHYQTDIWAESKFFRVLRGGIRVAFIDLRTNSNYYLKSEVCTLENNGYALLIPRGFATGYLVIEDDTDVLYCSDNYYRPEFESGIRWNDPLFNIDWGLTNDPIISDKDIKWIDYISQ
ncbi:dTDP-4-dehydrorhamnose 3,5-epimerase family protein [Methylobacter sp. BlB1]|uniref:dTDP-4-dehydrorhamnose 3,5-epimerase family protein n=1 Tax=Methylobacter sp. BlB1 TaxID=2785914 RepID=UPI00189503BD|nr:dTDP-4-dehydrorhamnose 3,5-epimerase family protein [Methylobacter sp. BlB1]MBF6650304.1 dTDP-4-dehydrorhamnose 3,5-epimerase family protein [Methylobacter sp. BlB1]